ncbi:MAG TPA: protein kinase [Gemmatimonadaceae bacterium]|nr:protein kinase [Gemmatimonadaceae bacterium]
MDPLDPGPPADPIAPLREALRGHYDIIREIGQGAFATVYLAQDHKHERKVALKVLHADPTSETGELRFIREIRLLARLQHPNILPLHDSGHVEALLYYVMPYVAGETLRDRINRERHIDIASACNITREVADALAYAHAQGVIHRDIKPENILLSAGHPILADFGIARAIDLAGVRQLTQTGMGSPGTPAYMSPEQLMGDRELDGRSDTYSLGCVLFEMLTGTPPFSGKEGFVRRFTEPPPAVSPLRRDAPRWIDDVITTALARDQNDRYQTAHEFASALVRSMTASGERVVRKRIEKELAAADRSPSAIPIPSATQFRAPINVRNAIAEEARLRKQHTPRERLLAMLRRHPAVVAGSAAAIALLAVLVATNATSALRNAVFPPQLDSARVALLPFSGNAPGPERDHLTSALYGALSQWRGLSVASDQDVADALRSVGPPKSTREASGLARRVGARRFVWGQLDATDSSQARAQLYDAASGAMLNSIRFGRSADRDESDRAVRELLKTTDRPAAADGGDGRTTSFPAWIAYANAHTALRNGNYENAERAFRSAAAADPEFAPAHLWLAQTLAWVAPSSRQEWRDQVNQALHSKSGLSDKDRLIGVALSNLAEKRYPDACNAYSRIVAADSVDFVGTFGMGQCRALDSLVLPSRWSPSHWEFRSRFSDAAEAFMKAVAINPAAHSLIPFEQIQVLLPIASTKTRRGMNASGDDFAAFPSLIRDTVVFVPYPLAEFSRLSARATGAQQSAALARNLDVLLDFTTDWTRNSPNSALAYLALGDVLEARGEIARTRSADLSAVQAIDRARQLASTPREKFLAATGAAWLLFKQGEFARSRLLTDSILGSAGQQARQEAATIIGLAALTGKLTKLSELERMATPYAASASDLPVPVMDAAASFFAFAALGVCGDTTLQLEKRLDDQVAHYIAEDQQATVMASVKARPLSMIASCTGAKASTRVPSSRMKILPMQQAFANGDSTSLRSMLANVAEDAKTQRPGDIALDFSYQVAWLRAASGDTLGAIMQLDRTLGGIPSMAAAAIREPASAAAAGRAMALRAELAAARNETAERRKWARAVVDLWGTADSPLQPVVARMRRLSASSLAP